MIGDAMYLPGRHNLMILLVTFRRSSESTSTMPISYSGATRRWLLPLKFSLPTSFGFSLIEIVDSFDAVYKFGVASSIVMEVDDFNIP